MKILIAILIMIHGLIVAMQSSSSFKPSAGVGNPSWLNWFPANLGQSWFLNGLGIEQASAVKAIGGILWLAAGIVLVAAGLGAFGFIIPFSWWRGLALAGAIISLVMLLVYFHPFFAVGIGASVVLLAALLAQQGALLSKYGL